MTLRPARPRRKLRPRSIRRSDRWPPARRALHLKRPALPRLYRRHPPTGPDRRRRPRRTCVHRHPRRPRRRPRSTRAPRVRAVRKRSRRCRRAVPAISVHRRGCRRFSRSHRPPFTRVTRRRRRRLRGRRSRHPNRSSPKRFSPGWPPRPPAIGPRRSVHLRLTSCPLVPIRRSRPRWQRRPRPWIPGRHRPPRAYR